MVCVSPRLMSCMSINAAGVTFISSLPLSDARKHDVLEIESELGRVWSAAPNNSSQACGVKTLQYNQTGCFLHDSEMHCGTSFRVWTTSRNLCHIMSCVKCSCKILLCDAHMAAHCQLISEASLASKVWQLQGLCSRIAASACSVHGRLKLCVVQCKSGMPAAAQHELKQLRPGVYQRYVHELWTTSPSSHAVASCTGSQGSHKQLAWSLFNLICIWLYLVCERHQQKAVACCALAPDIACLYKAFWHCDDMASAKGSKAAALSRSSSPLHNMHAMSVSL